jgi:dTDP-D-glucose 4,6-dehydratase
MSSSPAAPVISAQSSVTHLLDKGYRVTVLDSLMYGEQNLNHLCANPDFDFHRGDARDEKLVGSLIRDADVLIPLAAIVGAPACDLDPAHGQLNQP